MRNPDLYRWRPSWSGVATLALVVATALFVCFESPWGGDRERLTGQAAFVAGSIGTEFIPPPVLEVISDLDTRGVPLSNR